MNLNIFFAEFLASEAAVRNHMSWNPVFLCFLTQNIIIYHLYWSGAERSEKWGKWLIIHLSKIFKETVIGYIQLHPRPCSRTKCSSWNKIKKTLQFQLTNAHDKINRQEQSLPGSQQWRNKPLLQSLYKQHNQFNPQQPQNLLECMRGTSI